MDASVAVYEIRNITLKKLELLRQQKLIGKSIDVGATIEYWGGIRNIDVREQAKLFNDKYLREALNVSKIWINILNDKLNNSIIVEFDVHLIIFRENPLHWNCQRCQLYTGVPTNHDNLCDRCVRVLRDGYLAGKWRDVPAVLEFAEYYKLGS